MIRVIAEGLVKRYGPLAAVDHASLELPPGELTCLLGPPGAGKSTLARLLAGLESLDDGEIYFGERMVHGIAPGDRGVGMVFQDHALWPALAVRDNVGYPLKLQGIASRERRRRVEEILTTLRIDSLADSRPDALSPAQSLRVALARAIVTQPDVLILDEPLAGVEPRHRDEAWDEIRRLRAELGLTTLFLTSNVAEALAHSERLAVMDLGRILQSGEPQELYNQPIDVFVARLLGPTNLLQGQVDGNGNGNGNGGEPRREVVVRTPVGRLVARANFPGLSPATPVTISIRPETLTLGPAVPIDSNRFPATIERIVFHGGSREILLRGPGDWPVTAVAPQCHSANVREGQTVTLSVAPEHVTLLMGKFAVAGGH
ncbi:ABC transporter ATP-binding protein [Paludisphaera borealis]|uniref:Maltose/maltodextrin import ATP-binding protein MalK n=1 Tax=Paludisphaera borealis TaxID=1387353 RepID=A0A1U7CM82_9BACT|nr:ABC transporter ATP-binding protein [Paludisphaera borealis]APW60031.1 Maltose/maltodextrin import ATP-binding protein MalK [Paludisphaera borealis]